MPNLKRIPVTQLKPGQFVVDISQQLGHMRVSASGWVRTQIAINELIAKGIVSVVINEEKHLKSKNDDALSIKDNLGHVPFNQELDAAKKAVNRLTKELSKAFELIRHNDLIDATLLHFAAMEFISSSYRNSAAVLSLVRVTYYKDFQLGHALRCAAYFSATLRSLEWPADVAQNWVVGALLHDIGKLQMSQSIQQPNMHDLTEQQRMKDEFVKPEHVQNGINIAEFVGSLTQETIEIIEQHHERLDGSGYPTGQKLTDLNDGVRLFCIIDEFDRMTRVGDNGKPYGVLQAFRRMLQLEKQFDFELLQRFIKCIGVYPPGTLVKLSSGKVGLVLDRGISSVHPNVKVIYNDKMGHHVEAKNLDLSNNPSEVISGLFYGNKIGIFAENYL
ncbi:HD domain-containing protein [Psychrosphaera sp. B3R10]|uniref:HD-GYP domain-containing protein n=1 Tax=unclassified Psychrosphaera TaxID=2641570 RepID=UPI001C09D7A0|nr:MULTISPECIES: HD domain-containing phosphohydrolase [unclassified Psychrosphaera]MBU2880747.1 HD domain-containing protein [Psychrosphaera sp. I2R16]MBU2991507.1 HD domain-containing protein [Psychrosphaera sp. B3R10]